jgi:hypothetical protein
LQKARCDVREKRRRIVGADLRAPASVKPANEQRDTGKERNDAATAVKTSGTSEKNCGHKIHQPNPHSGLGQGTIMSFCSVPLALIRVHSARDLMEFAL